MPAAGYKLFVTGDVLTAAQVNDYLMLQTVMVFANSAARTSALSAVLAEGLVSYLQDTNVVEIYTGAAWVSLDDPNAIQNTIVDAKGDLIAATAADTPARLAVGANDTMLVGDSTAATGLAYKSAATLYPWTAWSPTYTNLTIGNGVVTARYQQIGKTINVYWKLVWGSTTSMTAYPLISYPATAAQGNYFMGASYLLDNSASAVYTGLIYAELGKASFQPLTQLANSTYTQPGFFTANTVPFTWTTNDEIICNFTYEAA